jgi:hypothetical protein
VKETVGGFLGIFGVDRTSTGTKTVIIVFATVLMYCLDFAINTGRTCSPLAFSFMILTVYSSGRHPVFHS